MCGFRKVTQIIPKTEVIIGFISIHTLTLQAIRINLVVQTNTSPFLT
ncbi:Uncharacterised protein [Vibrio cholerae]|nr:Uncharacterised protein [Vibrio cholerae]CSB60056.1 Uncharacterised protein [Vibrio cholerae]CSC74376.1 Uncharacterised protein [Vibrio cholerae]CSI96951.1 Uncharacterised protein [Vibrio cholerae]